MKHQCPQCRHEYNAELNFCPRCGEPSKASLKNFAKESADKHEATSESSASNVTSHMDEFFSSKPRQVKPLHATEGGARTVEASLSAEGVKDPVPAQDTTRRAKEDTGSPSSPSPLAGDAAYYRSFRTLSMAIIIGNVLTALSVIGLALIFTFSQQRQWNMSQERLTAVIDKVMATNETLMAKLEQANARGEQSNARLEKSAAEIAELKQNVANLGQRNAATEDSLREVKDKFAEQRLAALPANLTKRESSTFARDLASISAKINNHSDKRAIETLRQRVINKEDRDRTAIYKEYARVLPKLDEKVRAEIENKVGKPLLGD